mgnify:CR=1 FL=1
MRLLQLCKKFPYPLKDGESIAVMNLSRSLHDLGCDVSLLAMNTTKHFCDVTSVNGSFKHFKQAFYTELDNTLNFKDAFMNLFSRESYHISRFKCPEFEAQLIKMLKENTFDVVQLETLYMAPYIPIIRKYSKAIIAMRAHNVEHEIWSRVAQNTTPFYKKLYLKYLTNKLRKYEINQLNKYDLMIAISQKDLDTFRKLGYKNAGLVTPIGLDSASYKADNRSYKKDISLSFIGSLDWMPNLEGLKWFLDNVWDTLLAKYPNLKLHVAGRNTPTTLINAKYKNVKVYGEVDDAKKFINRHTVMVVPLLSGSGMRAKILEGMALGKVVLTTQLGLEGINAKHKEHVLVADTAAEFIEALDYCYRSNGSLSKLGKSAQKLVNTEYSNLETAKSLIAEYQKIDRKRESVPDKVLYVS